MPCKRVLVIVLLCFSNIAFASLDIYDYSGDDYDYNNRLTTPRPTTTTTTTTTKATTTKATTTRSSTARCGVQSTPPFLNLVKKIVRGREAKRHSFPWQILIVDPYGETSCGGTIVNPTTILTAAHCVVHTNGTRIPIGTVRAGLHNLRDTRGVLNRRVQRVIYHSEYLSNNAETSFYDIAVLKLSSSLTFGHQIQPLCLPSPGEVPLPGKACVITGWGSTDYEPETFEAENPQNLLQAEVKIVNDSTCLRTFGTGFYNSRTNLCAGGNGRDACQGDSGGPLQCKRLSSGVWYLAGITSWGEGCGDSTPGVYTQVEYYLNWIRQRL